MDEILKRFRDAEGRPNVGLIIAVAICVLVVLGLFWQVAGRGGAGAGEEPSSESQGDGSAEKQQQSQGATMEGDVPYPCDSFFYDDANFTTEKKDAAEDAARKYAKAVYGYAGTDTDAYETGVEKTVFGECFWNSATAEDARAAEEIVRQGGETLAPEDSYYLVRFVGLFVTDEKTVYDENDRGHPTIQGEAVWISRPAGTSGTKRGDLVPVQQDLTLVVPPGGAEGGEGEDQWRVSTGASPVADYVEEPYLRAAEQEMEKIAGPVGETTGRTTGVTMETTSEP